MNIPKVFQKIGFGIIVIVALFGFSWAIILIFTEHDPDWLWYKISFYGLESSLLLLAFGLIFFFLRHLWIEVIEDN